MKILLFLSACFVHLVVAAQNIGMGTATPNASAMLDVQSTTKGFLMPRMTLPQRNLIASPATGLIIYQTDNTPGYYYYNGSVWTQLATGSSTNFWTQDGINIYNNNTGRVGIGTTVHEGKLTAQSPSNDYGIVHTAGGIMVGTWIGSFNGATGGWIGTKSNHPLNFFTSGGDARMTILQNGNIGIGVTDPGFLLDLGTRIRLRSGSASETAGLWLNNTINSTAIGFIGTTNDNTIGLYGNTGGAWGLAMNTTTGNIGIGTLNPAARLHINQDNEALRLSGNNAYLSLFNGGVIKGYLQNRATDNIELSTASGNTIGNLDLSIQGTPYLSVKNNGQVSINGGPGVFESPVFTINGAISIKGGNEWYFVSIGNQLQVHRNGASVAFVDSDGEWVFFSDISLKENVSPYKSVLAEIKNLQVSTYRYKSNAPDSRSFGLIAQNVAQYFPEIVSETADKDGHKLLGIAYGKTGVLALKAIQEQQVIIEKLLLRVEELEKRLMISTEKK